MKSNLPLVLLLVAALVGCNFPRRQQLKIRRVTLYDSADEDTADADRLVRELKDHEDAIAKAKKSPPSEMPSLAPTSSQDSLAPAAPSELTVDSLIAELEKKDSRTLAEEETYKRLLGVAVAPVPPADSTGAYALLSQARDSLLRGDYETARLHVSRALRLVRDKTNPVIERAYFATEVRSYGNGDAVSAAAFRRGQRVLLVVDLSNFACRPVGSSSPPELYYTKMTQRLAIYDAAGKIYWQKSYESVEYQSAQYVDTIFIPQIFNLPSNLKSGEYILKVEIHDLVSARQTQSGVDFTVN